MLADDRVIGLIPGLAAWLHANSSPSGAWVTDVRTQLTRVPGYVANAALVVASLIVTLVVMELGARIINGDPVFALENLAAKRIALLRVHTANDYHPVIGWVLKPNMSMGPDFTTGEFGLRLNKSERTATPKGAILAVGDSFT